MYIRDYYAFLAFLAFVCGAAIRIDSPHRNYPVNLKGQTHCHTTGSDGKLSAADAMKYWKSAGYDFAAITDHDKITTDPKVAGIIHIPAAEISISSGRHMNNFNINKVIKTKDPQQVINNAQVQGGIVQVNHAHRDNAWTAQTLSALNNLWGIEIMNLESEVDSTDLWDALSSSDKKVWGTIGNDMHDYAPNYKNLGWNVVNVARASKEDIVENLKLGNFYPSEGPTLFVQIDKSGINMSTNARSTIKFIKKGGAIAYTTTGMYASYMPKLDDKFIRIEVTDSITNKRAWSQPLFISEDGPNPPEPPTPDTDSTADAPTPDAESTGSQPLPPDPDTDTDPVCVCRSGSPSRSNAN